MSKKRKNKTKMVKSLKEQKPPQVLTEVKSSATEVQTPPIVESSQSPLRIFIGFDDRQPISLTTLLTSIYRRSSKPVAITPIVLPTLPLAGPNIDNGLTPFTWSRFMVPWLCNYKGWALFLDIDMILLDDISKLFDLADDQYALMVSKNTLRFEWASMMLFNCGHPSNRCLTPQNIVTARGLHGMSWVHDHLVGALPGEWNHLVGYDKERPDAKLVHFTQGVPAYPETADSEYKDEWMEEAQAAMATQPWLTLMGNSVHAKKLADGSIVPKYKKEAA